MRSAWAAKEDCCMARSPECRGREKKVSDTFFSPKPGVSIERGGAQVIFRPPGAGGGFSACGRAPRMVLLGL